MGEVIELNFEQETDLDRAEEILDDMIDAAETAEIPPSVMLYAMCRFIKDVRDAAGDPVH